MNIKSSNIKIYPTASRSMDIDYGANINLEQNIVGLINNTVDNNNYIVGNPSFDFTNNKIEISELNCVLKGYSVKILNFDTDYPLNNTSIQYHLGLSIETIGSGVGSDPIRVDGYDYSGDNTYTGVRLEITENNVPSIPLYLGYIAYNDDTHKWEFIANSGAIYKFIGNTVQIDLDKSLNLTEFNYSGSLQDWLKNYIVIDDGEI